MNEDILLSAPRHVREEVQRILELHRVNALALRLAVGDTLKFRAKHGEKGLPTLEAAVQAYVMKATVKIES